MFFRRSRSAAPTTPAPTPAPAPAPPPPPPAPASNPLAPDAETLFALAYRRLPNADERTRLAQFAPEIGGDPLARMRAIVCSHDRQHLDTPLIIRFSEEDVLYVPVTGIELAIDRADTYFSIPFFQRVGAYEPHVFRFLEERVRPGMTFVDIGANLGYFTVLASKWVGPEGRVIAFEPASENNRLILLSLARNGCENVTLHPLALSGGRGLAYYSNFVGPNGGFLPPGEATLRSGGCVVVPTVALDEMIDRPVHVIKLDVEGAEGFVLAGAKRTIEAHLPIIVCEFSMEMLPRVSGVDPVAHLEYFTNLGYRFFILDRGGAGLVPIPDVRTFIAEYGIPTRIEDLALLPPGVE